MDGGVGVGLGVGGVAAEEDGRTYFLVLVDLDCIA